MHAKEYILLVHTLHVLGSGTPLYAWFGMIGIHSPSWAYRRNTMSGILRFPPTQHDPNYPTKISQMRTCSWSRSDEIHRGRWRQLFHCQDTRNNSCCSWVLANTGGDTGRRIRRITAHEMILLALASPCCSSSPVVYGAYGPSRNSGDGEKSLNAHSST